MPGFFGEAVAYAYHFDANSYLTLVTLKRGARSLGIGFIGLTCVLLDYALGVFSVIYHKLPMAVVLACLALFVSNAQAVDWDHGGDGTTWNESANWDAGIPAAGDNVVINNSSINGGNINFDFAEFGNLIIGGPTVASNNMGGGLTLDFSSTNLGNHFATPGGTLTVKAGTGAVTINNANFGPFNLNSGNIVVEDGVTGDFSLGTPPFGNGIGMRLGGPANGGVVETTLTNNSDQNFLINIRQSGGGAHILRFTLHSSDNGTPGDFRLPGHSIDANRLAELALTGDARVELTHGLGSNSGGTQGAAVFSSEVNTEITKSSAGIVDLNVAAGNNAAAGVISGNVNLLMDFASADKQHLHFTNNDTYVGETRLGSGGNNGSRGSALIRDGTHVGGGSYLIVGRRRDNNPNSERYDGILGGSGLIELQSGATFTAQRVGGSAPEKGRAVIAPGNTGYDLSGVIQNTGAAGLMQLGNQGIGTLTVSAEEVIIGEYGRLEVQVNGSDSDLLNILAGTGGNTNAGNLNLASSLNELFIDADLLGDADGTTYTLISWEGTLTGTFDSVLLQDGGVLLDITADAATGFQIDGFDYNLMYGPNSLQLVGPFSPSEVPEPAGIALWTILGLTLAGYGWARRKQLFAGESSA